MYRSKWYCLSREQNQRGWDIKSIESKNCRKSASLCVSRTERNIDKTWWNKDKATVTTVQREIKQEWILSWIIKNEVREDIDFRLRRDEDWVREMPIAMDWWCTNLSKEFAVLHEIEDAEHGHRRINSVVYEETLTLWVQALDNFQRESVLVEFNWRLLENRQPSQTDFYKRTIRPHKWPWSYPARTV